MKFRNNPTFVPIPEEDSSAANPSSPPKQSPPLRPPKLAPGNPLIAPFTLLLAVLILSGLQDAMPLHHQYEMLMQENQRNAEVLQDLQKQETFLTGTHEDLERLANTDPVARQLLDEFFAQKSTAAPPEQK